VHQKQQSQVNAEAQEAMTQQIRGDSQRRLSWRAADASRSVSVVMLTHNRPDITRQAIDSLLNTLRGNFELIIFDNASDAPTVSMLRGYAKDPRVKLTFAERNFGVSGGRRRAAKAATGDYLFFIDSDIVIDDADLLVKLIERLEDTPDAGACCCRVVFPNGEVQFNGGRLEQVRPGVVRFGLVDSGKRIDDLSTLEERECEWIPGGATMWRRDAHERFEPSDKMLGAFEDNEMCLRVRKAGVRLLNCPTATVTHYHHTFRQEQDTRYLQSRYDRERIITSMGVLLRDHGLLVHDDDLYRMVGLNGLDQAAIVARLQQAADAGKTNETA
jgi:GT2 family glycosyltransferase